MDLSETFTITEQNAGQSLQWTNVQCTLLTIHIWVNKNITQSLTFFPDYLVHGKLALLKSCDIKICTRKLLISGNNSFLLLLCIFLV